MRGTRGTVTTEVYMLVPSVHESVKVVLLLMVTASPGEVEAVLSVVPLPFLTVQEVMLTVVHESEVEDPLRTRGGVAVSCDRMLGGGGRTQ